MDNDQKEQPRITVTLKRTWDLIDGSKDIKAKVQVGPGTYELERIPNPFGHTAAPWLVLKGTKTGASEGFWKQWIGDWDEYQIVLEENGQLVPAPTEEQMNTQPPMSR